VSHIKNNSTGAHVGKLDWEIRDHQRLLKSGMRSSLKESKKDAQSLAG
jgi:hypothetical protein